MYIIIIMFIITRSTRKKMQDPVRRTLSAITIQSIIRKSISNNKIKKKINIYLIQLLNKHPAIMSACFIKILKTVKKYPPRKNENKFIYGKVCELALIEHLNKILTCIDLDKTHLSGSEYKNDCMLRFLKIKYSIKVSKSGGTITIINKRNANIRHSIYDINFAIIHISEQNLYLFNHNDDVLFQDKYKKEDGAAIHYKGSIMTYLKKNKKFVYHFPETQILIDFKTNEYPFIEEEDIYKKIYDEL